MAGAGAGVDAGRAAGRDAASADDEVVLCGEEAARVGAEEVRLRGEPGEDGFFGVVDVCAVGDGGTDFGVVVRPVPGDVGDASVPCLHY